MVAATLSSINAWYQEPTQGSDRPKLLSKLAVLELCGWIEIELDRIIRQHSTVLNDNFWVETNIINKTYGFHYGDHFRPMFCRLIGEVLSRRLETEMEAHYPGDIDQLKSILNDLWLRRCRFAHADMNFNISMQHQFLAPSWVINQHRLLVRILGRIEQQLAAIMATI